MCERGTTREVIIGGKSISIDSCIADIVDVINKSGRFHTLGSCCGHGIYPVTIVVRDALFPQMAMDYATRIPIPRKRHFYRRDASGIHFLPEDAEKVR